MNGQNDNLPSWLSFGLKIGSLIVIGTIAFMVLSAKVDAINTKIDNEVESTNKETQSNSEAIKRHEEQIREIREAQIKFTFFIETIDESLKEIKQDNKEIKKELKEHSEEAP